MYPTESRIRIPALAIAVVMGVASTFGLTVLLEKGSAPADLTTAVLAARDVPTEVAINPGRIEVIAVREGGIASAAEGAVTNCAESASEVAIVPAHVEVVAVREGPTQRHLLSAVFARRAG